MKNVDVRINSSGARELLHSSEVEAMLSRHAQSVANRAGRGYASDTWPGSSRVIASAYTATPSAMVRESRDHNLLRALGGAR